MIPAIGSWARFKTVKNSTGSLELANTRSLELLTGYLIEKSLAVDNIIVFLMAGIIGAIVLCTIMILVGVDAR